MEHEIQTSAPRSFDPTPIPRPSGAFLSRSALLVAIALAGLLVLTLTSLVAAKRKTEEVYTALDEVNMLHRHVESNLRKLRSDIHLSGIYIRDYLLDNSVIASPSYRERLTELRKTTTGMISEIELPLGPQQAQRVEVLNSKLEEYWRAFDPILDWTPLEKAAVGSSFLRREVLPRREAVLEIARVIEEVNNANIQQQRNAIASQERQLHQYLNRMLLISLLLGLAVAVATVLRIHLLERQSAAQQQRVMRAEQELRRLSQQLVLAQEEERKSLSRELHDEVGQILTGLRIEVGNAARTRLLNDGAFEGHLRESKHLVDSLIQTVRHLSMGLRPSMLDDLGLQPALEWQARDFSKRCNVPVNCSFEGDLDRLGEPHRTAIYRIVQESLTNCARHSRASLISLSVRDDGSRIRVLVHDDGVGLPTVEGPSAGLGLVGIKERVRELAGSLAVSSQPGAGTTLDIEIPAPAVEVRA